MPWIVASLVSAFFLGCYDLCTKHAVRDNAVLPVLFFANLCSALIWLVLMALHAGAPTLLPATLTVAPLTWHQHGLMLAKSALVAVAWVCSYFAVKHLPVSISSPIRATIPAWTFIGALVLLAERPTLMETLGIVTTLVAFVELSFAGAKEGIHFHRDKWIGYLMVGTVLAALAGLYDKYLLGRAGFTASTMQAWFSIYLALLFLPLAVGWKLRWWPRHTFEWRWSVIGVSLTLLVGDYVYFNALRDPHALISVVSSLRRGSALVAFAGGVLLYKEGNARRKIPAVIGVLIGIALTLA